MWLLSAVRDSPDHAATMQPMAANPLRVFVSHIHEEAALGAVIKGLIEDVFRGHGVVAFLSSDRQDLPAGRKWIEVIERELDQAKVVVSLLSPTSLRRPWVNIELGAAWIKHRHIIPLCHSNQRVSDLPRPFGDFNAVGLDQEDAAERFLGGVADGFGLAHPRRFAFKEMLAELRAAAAGIEVEETSAPQATSAALDLQAEQIRILQVLAAYADRGIDEMPQSSLAAEATVGLAALKHHLSQLEGRDFVYVSQYYTEREPDVRILPDGVGWLMAHSQMPGTPPA